MKLLSSLAGVVLLMAVPGSAHAQPASQPSLEEERLDEVLRSAVELDSLLSWAPLFYAYSFIDYLPLAVSTPKVNEACPLMRDPDALAACQFLQLELAERSGDSDSAAEIRRELGLIDQWALLGPFPNEGQAAMDRLLPPQVDGIDLTATVEVGERELRWLSVSAPGLDGYHDFREFVRPASTAAALATATVELPAAVDGYLDVAVDGAYQVWVDGVPVGAVDDHRGGGNMRELIPIQLSRGSHSLTFKVGVSDTAFGFHVRLLDRQRRPITGVSRSPSGAAPLAAAEEWPEPISLLERIRPLVDEGSGPETAAQAAFVLSALSSHDPTQPWAEMVEQALAAGANDHPRAMFWLAAVDDQFWRKVERIERAAALDPDDPAITMQWIRLHAGQMGHQARLRAAARVAELIDQDIRSVQLEVWYAAFVSDAQMGWQVYRRLLRARERFGDSVELLRALSQAAGELEQHGAQIELARARLHQDATDFGAIEILLQTAVAEDTVDDVRQAIDTLHQIAPHLQYARMLQSRLASATGDIEAAIGPLLAAHAQCPGDSEPLQTAGQLELLRNDQPAAGRYFEQALALNPQNATLREYLDAIEPMSDRFYADYIMSTDQIMAASSHTPDPDDVDYRTLVDQRVVRVYPNGLATTWVQSAHRVLTRNGADMLRSTTIGYSPDSEIVDILSARVIGPGGQLREVYDDMDYGPPSGPQSMYFDVRTRLITFPSLQPGDTLIFEYTISDIAYRNIFDDYFGDMFLLQDESPRDLVRYAVIAPVARQLFHNFESLAGVEWSDDTRHDGTRLLELTAHDMPPVPREPAAPGFAEIARYASVSTYQDWDTLSRWYWNLVEDQLAASPEMRTTVQELVDGLDDRRDRINAIHEYVVRNTRYVGLEFGIHGYKPYRTTECFARRFGDCKDTASLMKVMLDLAGIESYLALVRTRDIGRVQEQPASLAVFNHVITWIPEEDIYLDGTAGFSGSNELPSMDQGASSLIVLDGDGGQWRQIPFLPAEASVNASRIHFDLTGARITAEGSLTATGGFASPNRQRFEADDQRREQVEERLGGTFPGVRVDSVEFSGISDIQQPFEYRYTLSGGDFAVTEGAQVRLPAFGSNGGLAGRYAGASTRRLPLELGTAYELLTEVSYTLPPQATIHSLPEPAALQSPWARSSSACEVDGTDVICTWRFRMEALVVPPEDYAAFRAFLGEVDQAVDQYIRLDTIGGAP